MEMSRDAGSIPAASTFGGYAEKSDVTESILNAYQQKDSENTDENDKNRAGMDGVAFCAATAPHLASLFQPGNDPSLQLVMLAWPHLGMEAKRSILAIVRLEDEKARSRPNTPGS